MKTVNIKPVIVFANGKQATATQYNVVSIQDNLFDNVIFKYTLFDTNGVWAGESTFELNGETAYGAWDTTPTGAYEIIAEAIGLEIIQETNKTVFVDVE